MPSTVPLIKRSELDNVLSQDKHRAQWIIFPAITILTILLGFNYFQSTTTLISTPWLASVSTLPILLWLDALAMVAWLNLRLKTDIWLSSILYMPVAGAIWIIIRSVVVTAYLEQPNLNYLINNSAAQAKGLSLQEFIFSQIADQNFTIITIFLTLALWATFIRFKTQLQTNVLIWLTGIMTALFTVLNVARLFYTVPNFLELWLGLIVVNLLLIAGIMSGNLKSRI